MRFYIILPFVRKAIGDFYSTFSTNWPVSSKVNMFLKDTLKNQQKKTSRLVPYEKKGYTMKQ